MLGRALIGSVPQGRSQSAPATANHSYQDVEPLPPSSFIPAKLKRYLAVIKETNEIPQPTAGNQTAHGN